MHKIIKSSLFVFSIIFAIIFFCQSIYRVDPQDQSLQKNYTLQKMNLYPPKAFRIANIIENRPEFSTYFRLEKNFTEIFNFSMLYSNYLELAILLIFLTSIAKLFLANPRQAIFLCIFPLISLTFFLGTKTDLIFLFFPLVIYSLLNIYE